jgi:DNA-directed RNA polymerase specialized sigma24 family protein
VIEEYQDIILNIRSSRDDRNAAIRQIAAIDGLKADICSYVKRNSGTEDDGIMIFHDAIIAFVKKVFSDHSFELHTSLSGYIFGIAKLLWLSKLKKNKKTPTIQADEIVNLGSDDDIDIQCFINKDKSNILHKIMSHLRSNCREVLMYWAGGYSMQEIADLLGYKSEGMARKKKCECFKELIKWLEEHPQFKNELKNIM